jgi:multidrug transporter EmrE-like cation transporter
MGWFNFLVIVGGVLLNAAAQLFIKAGTANFSELLSSNFFLSVVRIVLQPQIFVGLMCYVVSVGVWIFVLSRVQVSVAYPMLSIGYIVSAFAGYFLFNEQLTMTKLVGIGVIVIGVALIAQTPSA